MKTNYGKRFLTFGEFIAQVYEVCDRRSAKGIVRIAIKSHMVEFRAHHRVLVS
jgi:hypothetical protein